MIGTWKLFLLLIFCLILVVHFAECSKRSSRRRNSVAKQSRRRQSAARQSRRRSSYVKQSRRRSSSVKQSRRRSSSAKQSRRRSSSIKHSRRRHRPGKPIKVNGGWTRWSQWTDCRGRCGQGTQERRRFCTNPRPMYGGRNCIGYPIEKRSCNTGRPCPVNGGWTNWSQWTVCRGRCRQGEQKRGRSCTNPRPMNGGRGCQGYAKERRKCDTGRPCPEPPVDGGWTQWSQWSVCSGRCGQGEQDRQRSCTNPRPMNGGRDCQGYARETRRCDTGRPCPQPPVDGKWSIWSVWTTCGGRCGLGTQNRFRSCNNPEPANGGSLCRGPSKETRQCDTGRPCAINGGWTDWGQWSVCRGRCGQGEQDRHRSCTNPRPVNQGKYCYGYNVETRTCDTGRPCPQAPVDGGWTIWSQWSVCIGKCGQGEQERNRSCTNPRPQYGGRDCFGLVKERRECDTGRSCPQPPVVGGWTVWSQWSVCRGRCGQGQQNRRRSCTNVNVCYGYAEETRKCDTGRACPADPCDAMSCKADQVCQVIKGRAMCIGLCPQQCPKTQNPVCGTDGKTYGNECMLRLVACTSNRSLKVQYPGLCLITYE